MKTLLKNFILINGQKDMVPVSGLELVIESGKIIYLDSKPYNGHVNHIKDLKGHYLVPGLINMHVHLPGGGGATNHANSQKLVALILSNWFFRKVGLFICHHHALQELYSGVTTVRGVGGVGHLDTELRNKINEGKLKGPRLIVADYAIAYKDGHMKGTVSKECLTIEEAKKAMDDLFAHHVDFIKLMITGGVLDTRNGKPGSLNIPEDIAAFVVNYAHEHQLKVAAHVECTEGMELAIHLGVDTIEHGADISDELVEEMKTKHLAHIITLSPAVPLPEGYATEEIIKNTAIIYQGMIACSRKTIAHNLMVGSGNDVGCPYVTHDNFYLELYYQTKQLGESNEDVIYRATLGNAAILGLEKEIGSIEVGKEADMIVLRENPLENILSYKNPLCVTKSGHFYYRKLHRNRQVEEVLHIINGQ